MMTDAELRLWMRLRGEQIPGFRFRRQVPMGPYVVDFACLKAHIVVEVDGGQHAQALEHDQRRTAWLESQGFRVLRFWDNDVLLETDEVVESIYQGLKQKPSPRPSPAKRGRE
jgi:very-short-patch-repair endonuclease